MTTLFISDLHLSENDLHLTSLFEQFLRQELPKADALYILGDLFAYWIGDDDHSPFNRRIIALIHHAAQTTPIYFLRGNRDFLLGERFSAETTAVRLNDETVIDCHGLKIVLLHGDSLCLADKAHQRLRRLTQHAGFHRVASWLPLSWRRGIAEWLRKLSQRHQAGKGGASEPVTVEMSSAQNPFDIIPAEIPRLLMCNDADVVIHGHTHQPAIHLMKDVRADSPTQFQRHIVLSDWGVTGNVLQINPDQTFELRYFV